MRDNGLGLDTNLTLDTLTDEVRAEYEAWLRMVDGEPGAGGLEAAGTLYKDEGGARGSSRKRGARGVYAVLWTGEDGRRAWAMVSSERRALRVGRHYGGEVFGMLARDASGPWSADEFAHAGYLVRSFVGAERRAF